MKIFQYTVYEKGPYEKYMFFRKYKRSKKHMFFEKVYMFFGKVYMFFEKVYIFLKSIYFLRKAPSRTPYWGTQVKYE